MTVPKTKSRIAELRRLFDDILEENRLVLRRKQEVATGGETEIEAIRLTLAMLIDEIGYLKTEQTFDRIAGAAEGPVTAPPDSCAIVTRSERTTYAAPRAVELNLSGFFHGANWHEAEWDDGSGAGFRWSDGDIGWIELRVDRHRPLILQFECLSIAGTAIYDDIRIVVDEEELDTRRVPNPLGSHTIFSASLPPSVRRSGEPHRFGIRCRFPSRPADSDPDSSDERLLGAAVSFFRLYPDETEPEPAMETVQRTSGGQKRSNRSKTRSDLSVTN